MSLAFLVQRTQQVFERKDFNGDVCFVLALKKTELMIYRDLAAKGKKGTRNVLTLALVSRFKDFGNN